MVESNSSPNVLERDLDALVQSVDLVCVTDIDRDSVVSSFFVCISARWRSTQPGRGLREFYPDILVFLDSGE